MTFSSQDFPNRFDHRQAQQRISQLWEERGLFHSEPDPDREPFTIVIPPPNVTGALHLGHALNNTLQDILIRMKRMQGYNALWMPGTDHAGIATQAVVEKRLKEEEGKTRHDLGRESLVQRIWQWKDQYEQRIIGQLKQMGCSCDWQRTRFTLDPVCARAVRSTFFDLFRKKRLYRGKRLVNWDTFLQTAVSDDEVFHEPIKGHFWHFRYPVIDPKPGEPTHVTIATTRPETMLGDTAVAVHPDPASALDKTEAELIDRIANAPAKDKDDLQRQLDEVRRRRKTILSELLKLREMARDGRHLMLPLVEREIPLVADEWAKPEMGGGCVKITPAHDVNDYEVGLRQNLPMINILNPDGTLNDNAGDYFGLDVRTARKRVVADMEEAQLLVEVEDREIDLAHSDRSKTPIEPYLADQWFIKMDDLAQSAIDAVRDERVKIFPARYAKGYIDWLAEKRDWPVSRQLWWGHRIAIWSQVCPDKENYDRLVAQLNDDVDIAAGRAAYQVEPDVEREAAEKHGDTVVGAMNVGLPYATIHICIEQQDENLAANYEKLGYVRDEDVLDTWFSSALWTHSTLGWPDKSVELDYYYPTSTLITSRDIITLWVARMVLMGLNNVGEVPFREVFIHPKILDGYGETMSKSKGNGIDPLDVIDKFGADALRFGMAFLTTETQDVRMPVQFECPHCQTLVEQTKKNRELPRIECSKCDKEFSTQWARDESDLALPRGAVVSERFELARNFCNKLWNASRFVMLNLADYTSGPVADRELAVEDRWILSRLSAASQQTSEALSVYQYSDAARTLYDFAWGEFCSLYVEIVKRRLQYPQKRPIVQRVLAHVLDHLLRLLHPIIPFITEDVWQLLATVAPQRGLTDPQVAAESIMLAHWPEADLTRRDEKVEERFGLFQAILGAVNEIRSRQNIAPKKHVEFYVRCSENTVNCLEPMRVQFKSLANATPVRWGTDIEPPAMSSTAAMGGVDVYVDLKDFIDVDAEIQRNAVQIEKLRDLIDKKEKKLANANFVDKAPPHIVQQQRDGLAQLQEQLASIRSAMDELQKTAAK